MPLLPCASVRLLGEADRVKLGGGLTVRDSVVEALRLPEVPVMVTLAVPVVAVLLAVSVKVLALVELAGLKEAVTPFGRPEAEKLTLLLKPFCSATVIALVPLVPCASVSDAGDEESVKLGGGGVDAVTLTLSKVPVARAEVVPLVTARPTYTVAFMVIVWLVPTCTQVTPSAEM